MSVVEYKFHINETGETLRLNSDKHIPEKLDIVWIGEKRYKVYAIERKYSISDDSIIGSSCWPETIIIYLESYDQEQGA